MAQESQNDVVQAEEGRLAAAARCPACRPDIALILAPPPGNRPVAAKVARGSAPPLDRVLQGQAARSAQAGKGGPYGTGRTTDGTREAAMEILKAMHRKAEWVTADTPVSDVAKLMRDEDIGAVPVGKEDRLIGMITDRDLVLRVLAEGRDMRTTRAEDVMSKGIVFCRTTQTVEDAIHLMDQKKIRRLPVLDDNKRLVGMLSLGDVSHAVPRDLSGELAQAVSDHHD